MEFARVVGAHGTESQEYRDFKQAKEFIDIKLRPEGVLQCEAAGRYAHAIDVKYVFVSHMVRTIETAINIFKNHPNKE